MTAYGASVATPRAHGPGSHPHAVVSDTVAGQPLRPEAAPDRPVPCAAEADVHGRGQRGRQFQGGTRPLYGCPVLSSRSGLKVESSASGPPSQVGTATAIAVSVAAGLLAALSSVPGAFVLWVGISVAIGRGDPTWNDGEEVWGTLLGLVLTGIVSFAIYRGVRASSIRVRMGVRKVVSLLWIVPSVAVHAFFAANVLS